MIERLEANAEWVHAIERAYVAAATGGELIDRTALPFGSAEAPGPAAVLGNADEGLPGGPLGVLDEVARAALGAVASHYLAVGTPRTLGLVLAGDANAGRASLAAHRAWFTPREVRRCGVDGATAGIRDTTLAEVLACDIVCVHAPILVSAFQLRRGTHVNLLHMGASIDSELRQLATVSNEIPDLGKLAAGLVDGRQLDELTVFIAGSADLARAVLATTL